MSMTVVPLFRTPAVPDAWHQSTAPGGYEWWRFYAEDVANHLRVVADFFDGNPFHPGYLRAYARYRRRPTRVPPPTPQNFRCVRFSFYRGDEIVAEFAARYEPSAFRASTERASVCIGPNQFSTDDVGTRELTIIGASPRPNSCCVGATLCFHPVSAGESRHISQPDHHWTVPGSAFDVQGTVNIDDSSIAFRGRGVCEHRFGTRPVDDEDAGWLMSGGALMDNGGLLFQQSSGAGTVVRVGGAAADTRPHHSLRGTDWRRSRWAVAYPCRIALGEVTLLNPHIVNARVSAVWVRYDAIANDVHVGSGFCEVINLRRLSWPIAAQTIERSIINADGSGGVAAAMASSASPAEPSGQV